MSMICFVPWQMALPGTDQRLAAFPSVKLQQHGSDYMEHAADVTVDHAFVVFDFSFGQTSTGHDAGIGKHRISWELSVIFGI